MKIILQNKITLPAIILLVIIYQSANSQVSAKDPTSLTDEYTIQINKLGDAQLELSEKMTAEQWQYFKQQPLMTDVSIAKRNLENSMAAYDLEDFKRDIDELNRTAKISVTIKAKAQYDGDGKWEVKTDQENTQIEKLTDKEYMISDNIAEGGMLVHENYKIFFPDGSKDVQQTKDEFGKTKFTYNLGAGATSLMSWNNILGALLILSSVVFFVRMPKSSLSPTLKPAPKQ